MVAKPARIAESCTLGSESSAPSPSAPGRKLTNADFRAAFHGYLASTGLTLGQLAQRSGVSKSAAQRMAEGETMPALQTFARMVDGMGLTDSERLRLLNLAGK